MSEYQGFWSYVHKDDEADDGRIARLATDVRSQFEMLTGESLALFLDRDAIEWGQDWRGEIDAGLSSVAFFIPVLTPRYFLSPECRRELQLFARRAEQLGVKDLVLPLYYVTVPALDSDPPTDDLMALVRTFQCQDWREVRFADVSSSEYRRAVADLAERLVEANRQAELAPVSTGAPSHPGVDTPDDEESGIIDRLAGMEEALPQWEEALEGIGSEISVIGGAMNDATKQIQLSDTRGKGFAGRVKVARILAHRIAQPAGHIRELGDQFTARMHDVDRGVRTLIQLGPEEARDDQQARDSLCHFFSSVHELAENTEEALNSVQAMIDTTGPIERMSRDLRPPLRLMRQGLTSMLEAREVMGEWVRLLDGADLDCDEARDKGAEDS